MIGNRKSPQHNNFKSLGIDSNGIINAVKAADSVFTVAIQSIMNALFPISLTSSASPSTSTSNGLSEKQFQSNLFGFTNRSSEGLAQRVETSSLDTVIEKQCMKGIEYLYAGRSVSITLIDVMHFFTHTVSYPFFLYIIRLELLSWLARHSHAPSTTMTSSQPFHFDQATADNQLRSVFMLQGRHVLQSKLLISAAREAVINFPINRLFVFDLLSY